MKNRSNIEVISQILQVANGGHATTKKIMFQAFLSYNQMKRHMELLTEMGFFAAPKILKRACVFFVYKPIDGMI
jgi:predicted transcriptional regulator